MTSPVVMSRGVVRPLVQLAWPVLAEQVLAMMVGFSDTLLAGHYLGESHLAAMTLIGYLMWTCYGLFAMISIGAMAMIARFVGAGDWPMANRITGQALLWAIFISLADHRHRLRGGRESGVGVRSGRRSRRSGDAVFASCCRSFPSSCSKPC